MLITIYSWLLFLFVTLVSLFGLFSFDLSRERRSAAIVQGALLWTTCLGVVIVSLILGFREPNTLTRVVQLTFYSGSSSAGFTHFGLEISAAAAVMVAAYVLIHFYTFVAEPFFRRWPARQRLQHASLLGILGVALCWFSSGLWTAMIGQVIAAISGWTILCALSRAVQTRGSGFSLLALDYIREKGVGILLVVSGATIFLSGGKSLDWSSGTFDGLSSVAALLILLGSVLQLQLFPAGGWITRAAHEHSLPLSAQLLISSSSVWASFGLLFKMVNTTAQGSSTVLLGLSVLVLVTALGALAQKQSQAAFSMVSSGIAGVSGLVLLVLGPRVAGTFFLVSQLGLFVFVLLLRQKSQTLSQGRSFRAAAFFLVFSCFGGIGFVSSSTLFSMMARAELANVVVLLGLSWSLLTLSAMKIVARGSDSTSVAAEEFFGADEERSTVWSVGPVVFFCFISAAALWVGSLVGGFEDVAQALGLNWSSSVFGSNPPETKSFPPWAQGAWSLLLLFCFLLGLPGWLARSEFRLLAIADEDYGVVRCIGFLEKVFRSAGDTLGAYFSRWTSSLVSHSTCTFWWISRQSEKGDAMTRGAIERVFRVLVEAPSKGAQLLQSGSIQFYILFTVGFTLVMLLHFLNHTKS